MDINEVQEEARKWARFEKTGTDLSRKFNGTARRMQELLLRADLNAAHELYQSTMQDIICMAEFIEEFDMIPNRFDLSTYQRDKRRQLEIKQEKNKSLEELKRTDWND